MQHTVSLSEKTRVASGYSKGAHVRGLRSLRNLNIEDTILTVAIYGVFALYAAHMLSYGTMQGLMILYVIRVFNLRHEKAHLPASRFSNVFEVFHTPYQEPFAEKRRKHLAHHRAHLRQREVVDNPHERLEDGFVKSLLSAALYHEIMFYLDVRRDRKISRERLISISRTTLLIALTIILAGAENFLAFFVAYRVASLIAWFSFSYLLHTRFFYETELGPRLPRTFKWAFEKVLGSGSVTAIFHHHFHHRRPNQFYRF